MNFKTYVKEEILYELSGQLVKCNLDLWPDAAISMLLSTYFGIASHLELPFNQSPEHPEESNSMKTIESFAVSQGVFWG